MTITIIILFILLQEALSMAADGSVEGVQKLQSLIADGMFGK